MDEPRTIAGLHCFDVLELLDDYVARTLDEELVERVNEHLAECAACASFGGRYAELVSVLHSQLESSEPGSPTRELALSVWRSRGDGG